MRWQPLQRQLQSPQKAVATVRPRTFTRTCSARVWNTCEYTIGDVTEREHVLHAVSNECLSSFDRSLAEAARVKALGGEGLMLRKTGVSHRGGRTADLLKVQNMMTLQLQLLVCTLYPFRAPNIRLRSFRTTRRWWWGTRKERGGSPAWWVPWCASRAQARRSRSAADLAMPSAHLTRRRSRAVSSRTSSLR